MNTAKSLLFCAALAGVSCAWAQAANSTTNAPAEIDEAAAGMLYTPVKGPTILVWDARTNANGRVLKRFLKENDPAKVTGPGLWVTTELSPMKGDPYKAAKARLGKDVSLVVALVSGGEEMPRMSVFPEDRVALVNADRYSKLLIEKLMLREVWRAIGFAGGTGYAPYRGCVMQPAFSDPEIAALMGDVLQPMTLRGFAKFEERFGMKRTQLVSYETACYGGWAPAPTNDAQRAIWKDVKEELSQTPTKPVRIIKK